LHEEDLPLHLGRQDRSNYKSRNLAEIGDGHCWTLHRGLLQRRRVIRCLGGLHKYGIYFCTTPCYFTRPTPRTIFGQEEDDTSAIASSHRYLPGLASGSTIRITISNLILPTEIPPHLNTGLSVVIIGNVEDWCIYYSNEVSLISELASNSFGFNLGTPIGGIGLDKESSITSMNVNSTTNNISLFLVDQSTQNMFGIGMHFTDDAWTSRTPPPH
jgi:hypothetical protein